MAIIEVNHKDIGKASEKVDTYISSLKRKMKEADSEVNGLTASWQGNDEKKFVKQWKTIDDKGSVYEIMITELENYQKNLKAAQSLYKDAQADALNKSYWL